jgi:hypothetical protein
MGDKQKIWLAFAITLAMPFYTAFVVQQLWNWFVVPALHASELSYVMTVGLLLLVFLFKHSDSEGLDTKQRDDLLVAVLKEVNPRHPVLIAVEAKEARLTRFLGSIGRSDANEALKGAICLALGWAIHTFLA